MFLYPIVLTEHVFDKVRAIDMTLAEFNELLGDDGEIIEEVLLDEGHVKELVLLSAGFVRSMSSCTSTEAAWRNVL